MRQPLVIPKITLEIMEQDAVQRVPDREYDDQGKDIGPNPNYTEFCKLAEGQSVLIARAIVKTDPPQMLTVISGWFPKNADNSELREQQALREVCRYMGDNIARGIISNFK